MATLTKERKSTKTHLKLQPLGDRVLFTSWAGETFKVGNEDELLLMREEDILAILDD